MGRVLAAVVGAVFAVAGAQKILGWDQWITDARAEGVKRPLAACIPLTELGLGVLLTAFELSSVVLGISTALLMVFTIFLAASIRSGSQQPCACFGSRVRRPPSAKDLGRNVVLMSLLVAAAVIGQ
ncbi:MAG: hypothetical protein EXQ63_01860 [Ilumatobacteraceae bacterium]|nr:hypothetical protein [Ilumatobacteraceae bacterium]